MNRRIIMYGIIYFVMMFSELNVSYSGEEYFNIINTTKLMCECKFNILNEIKNLFIKFLVCIYIYIIFQTL